VPVNADQQQGGIGIVFLIDISKSLSQMQFTLIKASMLPWIASLGPTDRAAIVTFGSSVNTVQDFTDDKNALSRAVRDLAARDQQTLLYQGLVQAIDLSRRLDRSLPFRRAIVVLTDGLDDQQGGAGRQEVLDKLAVDPTPIYGLGASAQNNAKFDAALKDFAGIVRASGGDYRSVDFNSLDQRYKELRDIINSTKHLVAECKNPPCTPDGSAIVVRLFMSQGATRLGSGSVTVRSVND
jgi:Mg-chelatase subunit ChlD